MVKIKVTRAKPVNLVFGNSMQSQVKYGAPIRTRRNDNRFVDGVSVITCTNRPEYQERIIGNYMRQHYGPVELIIILNNNAANLGEWEVWTRSYPNVRVYQLDESVTLGECLNYGVKQARYGYVAKFDDDDYYAGPYLQQAVDALKVTGADIVGKCSMFVYFEGSNTLAIAHQNQEERFIGMLAGATMVINKRVFNRVRFKHISQGEDTDFQRNCNRLGIRMYSTNKYNFACVRRAQTYTHTWRVEEDEYLRYCQVIGQVDDFREVVTAW